MQSVISACVICECDEVCTGCDVRGAGLKYCTWKLPYYMFIPLFTVGSDDLRIFCKRMSQVDDRCRVLGFAEIELCLPAMQN